MLGEKLSRLETDVHQIAQFGADVVNTVVRGGIFFCLNLVIMLKLNVAMTLSVLPLLPTFYLVRWKFRPLMQARAKDEQAGVGRATGNIAEHLGAVPQLHFIRRPPVPTCGQRECVAERCQRAVEPAPDGSRF
jgi:ABC-type bacteriocin/lantibiotic exporter with double-glycine peptidase domain